MRDGAEWKERWMGRMRQSGGRIGLGPLWWAGERQRGLGRKVLGSHGGSTPCVARAHASRSGKSWLWISDNGRAGRQMRLPPNDVNPGALESAWVVHNFKRQNVDYM